MRSRLSTYLPRGFVKPARIAARLFDQAWGMPASRWRAGNVVMFHFGRCGSTVLGSMLDQHPKIWWDGEAFHRQWEKQHFRLNPFDLSAFLRQQMRVAGRHYYGFEMKIHPEQEFVLVNTEIGTVLDQLRELGFSHFIVLERKNYLRRMLSQILGEQSDQRHLRIGTAVTQITTRLDLDSVSFGVVANSKPLLRCFEEIAESYKTIKALLVNERALELSYEDDILASGPQRAYEKICRFLGVSEVEVRVEYGRTNPFPIREMVDNFDELEDALAGTKYEWMLYQ
jgi:hypothetical protein